ncbi:hypothetical protein OHB12_23705 [Nocardia sp. NBC_01730]|uniref:hypothetical protein n=1 Tax=Nocardia sp. NBC_01730 TaxID=2975998 RepID=UPI002E1260B4|nr:hypothetical protein OHB12_23705 [Nocardia sp. NBC_01730]
MKTVKILLFILFWPYALMYWGIRWCLAHPEETKQAYRSVADRIYRYPKWIAAAGVVAGAAVAIGNAINGQPQNIVGGVILAVVVVAVVAVIRWLEHSRIASEIAARADTQHAAYLQDDDIGTYGAEGRPQL